QHNRLEQDCTGTHCVWRAWADYRNAAEQGRRTVVQYPAGVLVGRGGFVAPAPFPHPASLAAATTRPPAAPPPEAARVFQPIKKCPAQKPGIAFITNDMPSVVAVDTLAPLVPLLGFHRQRRNRACLEPAQRNRLAGFLTVAIGTIVNARERLIDLGDQLTLA